MQTFTKAERLCSKAVIDEVFEKGRSISVPLFRLLWLPAVQPQPFPLQIVITVPKRSFRRAADRNLLKRRIREAYRKSKGNVYEKLGAQRYSLMLIYTGKAIADYAEIEERIRKLLERLTTEAESHAVY